MNTVYDRLVRRHNSLRDELNRQRKIQFRRHGHLRFLRPLAEQYARMSKELNELAWFVFQQEENRHDG